MSDENEGIWEKLRMHRSGRATADVVDENAGAEARLKQFLENEKTREPVSDVPFRKSNAESVGLVHRPVPLLSGKLADYLGNCPGREHYSGLDLTGNVVDSWTIDDVQKRAAVAMALILTSHLARFAGTGIGERSLNEARDESLRCFEGRDAVRIEVEAYEILQWFAGAMNSAWQTQTEQNREIVDYSASEDVLTYILERAIREKIDLNMRYYTGSRGEFSERVISPIAISAEKYLIAFCHSRQEERVFRLSRILRVSPVHVCAETENMYFPVYKSDTSQTDVRAGGSLSAVSERQAEYAETQNVSVRLGKNAAISQIVKRAKGQNSGKNNRTGLKEKRSKAIEYSKPNRLSGGDCPAQTPKQKKKTRSVEVQPSSDGQKPLFEKASTEKKDKRRHAQTEMCQPDLPGFGLSDAGRETDRENENKKELKSASEPRLPGF